MCYKMMKKSIKIKLIGIGAVVLLALTICASIMVSSYQKVIQTPIMEKQNSLKPTGFIDRIPALYPGNPDLDPDPVPMDPLEDVTRNIIGE
jgi:hypothetical protein